MNIRIRLTRLHCNTQQEGGLFSVGSDEPYVILATIAPGGLLGRRLLIANTETFSGVDDGDNRHPNLDLLNEEIDGSVAVIAQVVEHDESDKAQVVAVATAFAQLAFANAMLNEETSLTTIRNAVADGLHEGLGVVARPLVDDDDAIGNPTKFNLSRGSLEDLAVGENFIVNRTVDGNGGNYSLRFEVRRMA